MSHSCELPCSPPPPPVCEQVCPRPPPLTICRVKPIMRGLHFAQTKRVIFQAFVLSALCGSAYAVLVAMPRKAAYKDFYEKGEFEDWADEMARKGLFQSVPQQNLKDNKHMKKK